MKKIFFMMMGLLLLFSINCYAESYEREGVKISITGPRGWFKRTGQEVTLGETCVVQYTKNKSPFGSPTLAVLVKDIPDAKDVNRYLPGRKMKTAFDIAEYDIAKIQQMGVASHTKPAEEGYLNGMRCATVIWEWDVEKTGMNLMGDLPAEKNVPKEKNPESGSHKFKGGKGVILTIIDKTDFFDKTLLECEEAIDSFRVGEILRSLE
jgi:hypothetical protein